MMHLDIQDFFNINSYLHAALFQNCSFVWEPLSGLDQYLKEKGKGQIEGEVQKGAYLICQKSIWIGKGTIIEPGAYIEGPCIIGENCIVRHGAYIRKGVITGNGCVIGHDTEIKHSILLDKVSIPHFNYVGDSILGNSVNLGAGVKCANLRLDRKSISFYLNGSKVSTHLRKLGAIIGDESQIGCNCVLNPGTLIGPHSISHPCLNFGGYIYPYSQIKSAQKVIVENYAK